MKRSAAGLFMLLTCTVLPAFQDLHAQGRGPSAQALRERAKEGGSATRDRQLAELDAWLRRLAGQFRVVVTYSGSPVVTPCGEQHDNPVGGTCAIPDSFNQAAILPQVEGPGRCSNVGDGPGVSCLFRLGAADGALNPELPRALLLGVDPDDPGIRILQVDGAPGIARFARGTLNGDTVTFTMECRKSSASYNPVSCKRVVRIVASSDGKRIEMTIAPEATPRMGNRWISPPGITRIQLLTVK